MPFQLSPGVNVSEIDLTTVVPSVATTDAAIAGVFKWGPVDERILISSEDILKARYGTPTNDNAETWFTAASYLSYGNRLYVSRAHVSDGNTASFTVSLDGSNTQFVISGNTSTGITTGDAVYGQGIDPLTVVDDVTIVGGVDTVITLNKEPNSTVASSPLEFFDSDFSFNAIANTVSLGSDSTFANHIVKNDDHWTQVKDLGQFDSNVQFIAKWPGVRGNSLRVCVCENSDSFSSTIDLGDFSTVAADVVSESAVWTVGSNTAVISAVASNTATTDAETYLTELQQSLAIGDVVKVGNTQVGYQYLTITSLGDIAVDSGQGAVPGKYVSSISFADRYSLYKDFEITGDGSNGNSILERYWEHWDTVTSAPGQSDYQRLYGNTAAHDEIHVVVVDEGGQFSGVSGSVIEVFSNLSRATDAKANDGAALWYQEVINQSSAYIWCANDPTTGSPSTSADLLASSSATEPYNVRMQGGRDIGSESTAPIGAIVSAYDKFKDPEDIDISLLLVGKSRGGTDVVVGADGVSRSVTGFLLTNYIIDNIAEKRKDCVVFTSPEKDDVVNNTVVGDIEQDVVDFRNACRSSSYAVMDSGYKYQYDKYNDVYRWIPLNGDIAGLCAQTDDLRDPWWSPAGFNRGNLKNVVKLAWNPVKAQRDILYKNGVNPIVNFPGQGIVLYGDKTMLAKPSAFDRINVRRLFIVLEKAIARAAKYSLFEFNDAFTRASFVNLVEPYLRTVQARRGIYDFKVVCDDTNNTPEIIDRNEFVGDIYIKPARSINFIQLNFVAVRTGVEFSEVIGQF